MLMLRSVWPLLIESALILLQTVPTHIEVCESENKIKALFKWAAAGFNNDSATFCKIAKNPPNRFWLFLSYIVVTEV